MLDNIVTLAGKFESSTDLQKYCDSQYLTIKTQRENIEKLSQEIAHLKSLISSSHPMVGPVAEVIVKSPEQTICEMEIEKLQSISTTRSLTLEETKRFDLVVKNLLLCKGAYKDIAPDFKKLPPGFTEASLVDLVTKTAPPLGDA